MAPFADAPGLKSLPIPWNFGAEARRKPFLAQVWYNTHRPAEQNRYGCGFAAVST